MTTYKDIRGTHIKTVTSDPPAPVNGQMWYNSTTQVMKGLTSNPAGAWATGGATNTGRQDLGGNGIQTAALIYGGRTAPLTAVTESYNGTSWTEVNDLNTARSGVQGLGTYTAALGAGGYKVTPQYTLAIVESWNGSNWTEVNDLGAARYNGLRSRQ